MQDHPYVVTIYEIDNSIETMDLAGVQAYLGESARDDDRTAEQRLDAGFDDEREASAGR